MRAVVIYESMFGGSERIARAMGAGLAPHAEVDVVNVDDAPSRLDGVDLVVVGGPTHAWGMSRASTRQSAQRQTTQEIRSRNGIRDWLRSLSGAPAGIRAVVFDTRLDKPRWLTGSAARGAAKLLRRHGFPLLAPPESFFATQTPGELRAGEEDRARNWAAVLAAKATASAGRR
ncbi:flavodoxin domain-containing protein [Amycolatopsis cynarae]|uniref:Flavodoxin domain-containing protein n=1 Tax=Amycolatopsis cynarae TaxID=2995223 RepID=A0ABY7BDG5_9PSEU|nr:flavodoxin domain-containing protein [Amycolatopsis sp. HUAS 11-8]WAL68956.1 flavodoxin domain-containing protein [Amycolatopsis sp. HUAS 11-8]